MTTISPRSQASLADAGSFVPRHIGPSDDDVREMLDALGLESLDALVDATIPETIRMRHALDLPRGLGEYDALARMREIASRNQIFRSFIGMGYHDCITPPVLQRNVLENPG